MIERKSIGIDQIEKERKQYDGKEKYGDIRDKERKKAI